MEISAIFSPNTKFLTPSKYSFFIVQVVLIFIKIFKIHYKYSQKIYLHLLPFTLQHIGSVEDIPAGAEQSPPDILWTGGDGPEDHNRSNLQRFHLKLRIRCIHTTLPALGNAAPQLANPGRHPSGLCGLPYLR